MTKKELHVAKWRRTVKNSSWQGMKERMAIKRAVVLDVMGIFQLSLGELVKC